MSNVAVIAAARSRLVDLLLVRQGLAGVAIGYEPPAGHENLEAAGSDTPAAIWMAAATEGQWEVVSLGAVRFVETVGQVVVLQVLPTDDGDRQEAIEARLAEMVGEVVDTIAEDVTLGIGPQVRVLPSTYAWEAGRMDLGTEGAFAARCEMTLTIREDRC